MAMRSTLERMRAAIKYASKKGYDPYNSADLFVYAAFIYELKWADDMARLDSKIAKGYR